MFTEILIIKIIIRGGLKTTYKNPYSYKSPIIWNNNHNYGRLYFIIREYCLESSLDLGQWDLDLRMAVATSSPAVFCQTFRRKDTVQDRPTCRPSPRMAYRRWPELGTFQPGLFTPGQPGMQDSLRALDNDQKQEPAELSDTTLLLPF